MQNQCKPDNLQPDRRAIWTETLTPTTTTGNNNKVNRQRSDINMKQTKLFLSFFQFNLNMFIHSVMLMWNSNESIQSFSKFKNLFKLPKSSNLSDEMNVTKSLIQLFFLKNSQLFSFTNSKSVTSNLSK